MEEVKLGMYWKKLLESASESVNDHLRLRNAYVLAENRILRQQIDGRMQLTESERQELAVIGVQLGKQALAEIATIATPDTILAWHRTFADPKVDTSEPRKSAGRPRIAKEIEDFVLRMARENRTWGYDRIQGALKHLGYAISDQTVRNILKRHRIPPAPERRKTVTWREFVRFHLDVLLATDFFKSEIWNWFGLLLSYLLGFLHKSLNVRTHAQRWGCWIKTCARSQTIRCGNALLRSPVAAGAPADARPPRSHEMDKVVRLSDTFPGPMRAGPLQYRRPFRGPPHCHDCEAA